MKGQMDGKVLGDLISKLSPSSVPRAKIEDIFRLFCERAGVGTHHDKIVVIVVKKAVVKVVKIGSSNKEKRVV